jgi:hypothetical protein
MHKLRQMEKQVDSISGLDHTAITYEPFMRNFYIEHPQISELTADQITKIRKDKQIRV